MKYQQVTVDVWKMTVTAVSYLALAFAAWVLLRLICACISLPGYLRKQQEEEQAKERRLLLDTEPGDDAFDENTCQADDDDDENDDDDEEEDDTEDDEVHGPGASDCEVKDVVVPPTPKVSGRRRVLRKDAADGAAPGAGAALASSRSAVEEGGKNKGPEVEKKKLK